MQPPMTTQIEQLPRPSRLRPIITMLAALFVAGALFVSISSGVWQQGWTGTVQVTQPYSVSRSGRLWYPDSEAISVSPPAQPLNAGRLREFGQGAGHNSP